MPLGSSPLTRGKRGSPNDYQRCPGLIPAHAGKTPPCAPCRRPYGAHPRSRGENPRPSSRASCSMGSSPLTRGKRIYRRPRTRTRRLIPAHAGKTALTTSSGPSFRAHPRSRGENKCPPSDCPRCPGSSPLTRGKPGATAAGLAGGGLIPAHAGKTNPPRREGGKPQGSSPLTRGKQLHASADNHRKRLIPAHAGKTAACKVGLVDARAHPRSRGENFDNVGKDVPFTGSSPLTRGKQTDEAQKGRGVRLIPAHAGKT